MKRQYDGQSGSLFLTFKYHTSQQMMYVSEARFILCVLVVCIFSPCSTQGEGFVYSQTLLAKTDWNCVKTSLNFKVSIVSSFTNMYSLLKVIFVIYLVSLIFSCLKLYMLYTV